MANRTYLLGFNEDFFAVESPVASEILEARYCMPFFWLTLFDLDSVHLYNEIPLLWTSKEKALQVLNSRLTLLHKMFGSTSKEIIGLWHQFVQQQNCQYFLLNTRELWMMQNEEGDFLKELQHQMQELSEMTISGVPLMQALVVKQAFSDDDPDCPFMGSTLPLFGHSYSIKVPWPEKIDDPDEPLTPNASESPGVLAGGMDSGFMIEEITKSGDNLIASLQKAMAKVSTKGWQSYVLFSADWCKPCLKLLKILKKPALKNTLAGSHIMVIKHEVWGDQKQLKRISLDWITKVPILTAIDGEMKCDKTHWVPPDEEDTVESVATGFANYMARYRH